SFDTEFLSRRDRHPGSVWGWCTAPCTTPTLIAGQPAATGVQPGPRAPLAIGRLVGGPPFGTPLVTVVGNHVTLGVHVVRVPLGRLAGRIVAITVVAITVVAISVVAIAIVTVTVVVSVTIEVDVDALVEGVGRVVDLPYRVDQMPTTAVGQGSGVFNVGRWLITVPVDFRERLEIQIRPGQRLRGVPPRLSDVVAVVGRRVPSEHVPVECPILPGIH